MTGVRDSFVDLERHRLQLEQNVAKLQASLRHWQQWEIEYEGMKEEILDLERDYTQDELDSLGEDSDNSFLNKSDSVLLTPKERRLLLVDDKGQSRGSRQVLGLLSRRIDYVQKGVKTVSSLLQTAEEKYAAFQVLIQPEVRNGEGLPLTEIHEELDEEDNIISSSTSKPGETAPQLVEALSRAGVKVSPETSGSPESLESQPNKASRDRSSPHKIDDSIQQSESSDLETNDLSGSSSSSRDTDAGDSQKRLVAPRKSVSFADGTKTTSDHKKVVFPVIPLLPHTPSNRPPSEDAARIQNDAIRAILATDSLSDEAIPAVLRKAGSQSSLTQTDGEWKVPKAEPLVKPESTNGIRKDMDENVASSMADDKAETVPEKPFKPIIPVDESPEDAALRRQMLQYNMGEVGAVVAELDLDEGGISSFDDDEEDYADDNSSVEEDEDQFGRTKRRVLSDEYQAEMKALEKRLKNVGPNAEVASAALANGHGEEQQPSNNPVLNAVGQKPKSAEKKGVRFASKLDIQEAPNSTTTNSSQRDSERKTLLKAASNPVRASVIERPFTASASDNLAKAPAEPDEYDPALVQQEVATEYHKMRNRMIQRQGGFMAQDADKAEVPLTEDEGGPKKMSRFKAARLGKA